jgi:signal transduction histidine kinase
MEKENRLDIAELKKISDLLHGAVDQARNTARGLYPGELEGNSLMHTLEELTSSTQNLSGVSCRLHCPEPILINDNNIATHLYKIAQEGVSNAVSHGKARSIEVGLMERDGLITLTVKDDGVGFIPDPQDSKGIGLKIMRYRAHLMGASFQVEQNSPHGVILKCSLKSP